MRDGIGAVFVEVEETSITKALRVNWLGIVVVSYLEETRKTRSFLMENDHFYRSIIALNFNQSK